MTDRLGHSYQPRAKSIAQVSSRRRSRVGGAGNNAEPQGGPGYGDVEVNDTALLEASLLEEAIAITRLKIALAKDAAERLPRLRARVYDRSRASWSTSRRAQAVNGGR
jgi:hypothetical protein